MINKNINLDLYKLTQDELFKYLQNYLENKNIKFDIIKEQIISINHPYKPIFVAHMDTVNNEDMKKPLIIQNNIIRRENGILGGDDRAGVNIILNHCKDINFIFTRDEEIGCLGVKKIANDIENYVNEYENPCFIELDRKSGNSLLADKHGYCNEDLTNDIMSIAPFLKNDMGAYTDIDYLIYIKPAVNMSVGYYNAHGDKEYLNIEEYKKINKLIPKLNKKLSNKDYEFSEKPKNYNYYDYMEKSYYIEDYDLCEKCEDFIHIDDLYIDLQTGVIICKYCLEEEYKCDIKILEKCLNIEKLNDFY